MIRWFDLIKSSQIVEPIQSPTPSWKQKWNYAGESQTDFFKPRRSGGDNSANTSIPTEHKARDTSIKMTEDLGKF